MRSTKTMSVSTDLNPNEVEVDALRASLSGGIGEPQGRDTGKGVWRPDMSPDEQVARMRWLADGKGRKGLRILIVTG